MSAEGDEDKPIPPAASDPNLHRALERIARAGTAPQKGLFCAITVRPTWVGVRFLAKPHPETQRSRDNRSLRSRSDWKSIVWGERFARALSQSDRRETGDNRCDDRGVPPEDPRGLGSLPQQWGPCT
jgi:hypothetical protein